jgi:hypothetical protein
VVSIDDVIARFGNTLTLDFSRVSATNAEPERSQEVQTRVAKGPPGSHVISGSWQTTKVEFEKPRTVTYRIERDTLTMTVSDGRSYAAKLDGTEAAFRGDPGMTSTLLECVVVVSHDIWRASGVFRH